MPRKKATKRQQKNNVLSTLQKLEKDFLLTPTKMSAFVSKDISVLKQKENKLKTAFNKSKNQLKNTESRFKAAAAAKATSAGKKLLSKTKKAYEVVKKSQTDLSKQLAETTKALEAAMNKHIKLVALKKHLSQFEKDWAKNSKKVKVKAKSKPKTDVKKAPAEPVHHSKPVEAITQVFENVLERITPGEKTEVTS